MLCLCRFIEYGEYKENLYGTSLDSIHRVLDQNKVCLVDVQPEVSVFKNMVGGAANQIHFSFKSNFLCQCKSAFFFKRSKDSRLHIGHIMPYTCVICAILEYISYYGIFKWNWIDLLPASRPVKLSGAYTGDRNAWYQANWLFTLFCATVCQHKTNNKSSKICLTFLVAHRLFVCFKKNILSDNCAVFYT